MQPSSLAKRVLSLLLPAVAAFYFYGLGYFPLVGPDEPRYAQVAREMLLRGDLITPTLGGHVWFEKPILLYWLMLVGYKIFGVTEFAARLGPAIAGVLTIAAIFWVARKLEQTSGDEQLRGFGVFSGLVTATTMGIIVFARAASFDILVTMTTTWAIVGFLMSELEAKRKRKTLFLTVFYVFIGLSLLAKGLVGLLPIAVVVSFFVLRRQVPAKYFLRSLVWGIPLSLAVASIWFGPVIARNGFLFVREFIIQHHFVRYVSNKFHHPQPIFFYPLILLPMTLPWTPFLLNALAGLRDSRWRSDEAVAKLRVFSIIWLVLPIFVFSFSASKLPGYILPVVPAAALLTGERLTRFVTTGRFGRAAMIATILLLLLFAVGSFFYGRQQNISPGCLLAIVFPLLAGGLLAFVLMRYRTAVVGVISVVTIIPLVVLLNCAAASLAERDSVAHLIKAADQRGYGTLNVGNFLSIDHTAQFYASGRLLYGADGEPERFSGTTQILERLAQHNGSLLVLAPLDQLSQLTELPGATTDVIANNGRMTIVAVRLSRQSGY